jgi:hypothetical protein
MRSITVLVVVAWGCAATPRVTHTVGAARIARLAPEVVQPVDAQYTAAVAEIDRDRERLRTQLDGSQSAVAIARSEGVAPDTAEVHGAKVARGEQEVTWLRAMIRVAEWRRAAATSGAELKKAQLLSHAGDAIEIEPFSEQQEHNRAGLAEAQREQARARLELDRRERDLVAAKARYADRKMGRPVATVGATAR